MIWQRLGEGYIGIMTCGIAFAFVTKHGMGYTVRFGLVESDYVHVSVEDAQTEALVLARRVLADCLRGL